MTTFFIMPKMFAEHLKGTNLKVPNDFENYGREKYPHFAVFMSLFLGNKIEVENIGYNANIIASVSDDKIRTVTLKELCNIGLDIRVSGISV